MLKNAYFWEKNCKNLLSIGGSAHETPLASGGCRLSPKTPALFLLLAITTLSGLFLTFNAFLLPSNKQISTVNVLLLLLSYFLHLFFTLNSIGFVDGGARIFLAPGHRVP